MRITRITVFQLVGLALVVLGISSCTRENQEVTPSASITPAAFTPTETISMPTEISLPVEESTPNPTSAVTLGALTPIVVIQPTLGVTATPAGTPDEGKYPAALLRVEKPGEMSRLTSPFVVIGSVLPGYKGMVNLQLFGENGRVISDQLIGLQEIDSGWVSLASTIQFESLAAGEKGLLVLSTRDYYGRRIAQTGVPILLLQIGESEYEVPQFTKQPVILDLPVAGGFAKKGNLHIEGGIHLYNNNPVIVELISQTGGITANKAVTVAGNGEAEFVPFALDVPYTVSKRTPVRLTIRQTSEISSGIDIFLYSQLIFLDP
jgi:hypothetical protein